MKFTCSQKDLANALSVVSKFVDVSSTLPVLNNILLKTTDNKNLTFIGTNLEMAITYNLEVVDVVEEGSVTVPAKLLNSYISYLRENEIKVSAEADVILINTKGSKTKIKGIPSSEFPPIPVVENEVQFSLKSSDLRLAIKQVAFCAAMNTTRPVLGGIFFSLDKKSLKMVATDSYRLSEKTVEVIQASGQTECIIPARTILELGSIFDSLKIDSTVEVTVSKNQILFSFNSITLVSRLVEGKFPNYEQIIPKNDKMKVNVNVSDLISSLKQIGIFAKENNNKVAFKVTENQILLTTDSTQYGEVQVTLECKTEGVGDAEVALNSQFVLDALMNIGSDQIILEIGEKTMPVIFKSSSSHHFLHIIMPLKFS